MERADIKLAIDMVVNAQDDQLFGGEAEYVINTLEDCGNEIAKQRKQIEALTVQVGVLREAVLMAVEMIETNAHERRHVRWKLKDTLASTPESALSEVRKAEREKCAALCEKSDRYRGDYFAAKIRAMGDE